MSWIAISLLVVAGIVVLVVIVGRQGLRDYEEVWTPIKDRFGYDPKGELSRYLTDAETDLAWYDGKSYPGFVEIDNNGVRFYRIFHTKKDEPILLPWKSIVRVRRDSGGKGQYLVDLEVDGRNPISVGFDCPKDLCASFSRYVGK